MGEYHGGVPRGSTTAEYHGDLGLAASAKGWPRVASRKKPGVRPALLGEIILADYGSLPEMAKIMAPDRLLP